LLICLHLFQIDKSVEQIVRHISQLIMIKPTNYSEKLIIKVCNPYISFRLNNPWNRLWGKLIKRFPHNSLRHSEFDQEKNGKNASYILCRLTNPWNRLCGTKFSWFPLRSLNILSEFSCNDNQLWSLTSPEDWWALGTNYAAQQSTDSLWGN
jgi:hypothetical protein